MNTYLGCLKAVVLIKTVSAEAVGSLHLHYVRTETTQFSSFAFTIVKLSAHSHKDLLALLSFRCFFNFLSMIMFWSGLFRIG